MVRFHQTRQFTYFENMHTSKQRLSYSRRDATENAARGLCQGNGGKCMPHALVLTQAAKVSWTTGVPVVRHSRRLKLTSDVNTTSLVLRANA